MAKQPIAIGLTRDRVVAAALTLADANGVEWLTMRRLSAHLGVSAPTLYWHVGNRDALLDATLELALADFDLPDNRPNDDPATRLTEFVRSLRTHLVAHPSITEIMGGRYPAAAHRLTLHTAELIAALGFEPVAAADRTRLVMWHVIGFTTTENTIRRGTAFHRADGTDPARFTVASPDRSATIDDDVAARLATLDLDALFELSLTTLVAGLLSDLQRSTVPGHQNDHEDV